MHDDTYDAYGVNTKNSFNTPPKAKKPRKTTVKVLAGMKSKGGSEKRTYPTWREGMTTLDYVNAYHAANASVHLTTVDYTCQ